MAEGFEHSEEYNGVVGEVAYEGSPLAGSVLLRVSPYEGFYVKTETLLPVSYVELPPDMEMDAKTKKSRKVARQRDYVVFNDEDGDEVIFEAFEGRGRARYCVNCVWREDFSVAEFFLEGRPGREFPHLRLDCGDRYRTVAVPPEVPEQIAGLLSLAGVPHNRQDFAPGTHVTIIEEISFVEGDSIPAGTRAAVLQPGADKGLLEVAVANGDRIDVARASLLPAPRLVKGDVAIVLRDVEFKSGKTPIAKGKLVTVKSRGERGMRFGRLFFLGILGLYFQFRGCIFFHQNGKKR